MGIGATEILYLCYLRYLLFNPERLKKFEQEVTELRIPS